MADIQTQLPVRVTDGTNTVAITGSNAFKIDLSSTGANSTPIVVGGTVTNVPSGTQTVAGTVTNVPSGTQTVAGTVTNVPSGTQTVAGTVTTNADADIAPGTAPSKVLVGGLVYNSSAPTATNGQSVAMQADANGNLKVNVAVGSFTPTGTQTVVGTVTNVPSGTQTVAGTVTNVPSGTQTVTGTVVATGTVTTVPSGTQTVTGTVVTSGTVTTVSGETSTGVVMSYAVSSTVSSGSTGTISYTVTTGKTLYLKGAFASSSGGPCKVSLEYNDGSDNPIAVGFYSTAMPFLNLPLAQAFPVSATNVVKVKIQNNSGSTQDVYATIQGLELTP